MYDKGFYGPILSKPTEISIFQIMVSWKNQSFNTECRISFQNKHNKKIVNI